MRSFLLAVIWIYQRLARPFHARTCLFHPTCSVLAATTLRSGIPLKEAAGILRVRFNRCRPPFQVIVAPDHAVRLVANDGHVFSGEDVNPALAANLLP